FTTKGRINEFQFNVAADPFNVSITPDFERKSRSRTTTFVDRALVGSSRGVRLNFNRRTVNNVDAAPICHPSRQPAGEALVGIGDPPVVFVLKLIDRSSWIRVSSKPELLDKLLFLFRSRQVTKDSFLFVGNDVLHILAKPLFVIIFSLFLTKTLSVILGQERRGTQAENDNQKKWDGNRFHAHRNLKTGLTWIHGLSPEKY